MLRKNSGEYLSTEKNSLLLERAEKSHQQSGAKKSTWSSTCRRGVTMVTQQNADWPLEEKTKRRCTLSCHLSFGDAPSLWFPLCVFLWRCLYPAGCACLRSSLRRYQAEAAWESELQRLTLNHHTSGRTAGHTTGKERISPSCLWLSWTQPGKAKVSHWSENAPEASKASEGFKSSLWSHKNLQRRGLCKLSASFSKSDSPLCWQCGTLSRLSYLFHYSAKKTFTLLCRGKTPWQKARGVPQPPPLQSKDSSRLSYSK